MNYYEKNDMGIDDDEIRILNYYHDKGYIIKATFRGKEAWKYILQIRYSPGVGRYRMQRLWKKYDKLNGYLIIYTINENNIQTNIGMDYYFNKTDLLNPTQGESDYNMFNKVLFEALEYPNVPKIIKKIFNNII